MLFDLLPAPVFTSGGRKPPVQICTAVDLHMTIAAEGDERGIVVPGQNARAIVAMMHLGRPPAAAPAVVIGGNQDAVSDRPPSWAVEVFVVVELWVEGPDPTDKRHPESVGIFFSPIGVTTRKCSECTTSGTLSELRPPVEIAAAAAL